MRCVALSLLAVGILFPQATAVQAAGDATPAGLRAAVLPFINATGNDRYDSLCEGLAVLVAGDLAKVDGFVVVERNDVAKIMAEHRFQHTGLTSADAHAQFGKLLGANLLVVGTFTLDNGALRIDLRAISVNTARVAAAAGASGPKGKLLETEKRALNELVRLLTQNDHKPRELSTDDTPEQTLHYIRGLGHFFENQFEAALAEFMTLAAEDADSEPARYWLVRCYHELKDLAHCAIECRKYLEAFPDGEHAEEVRVILQACKTTTGGARPSGGQ